jgi:hypothetical protein
MEEKMRKKRIGDSGVFLEIILPLFLLFLLFFGPAAYVLIMTYLTYGRI